MRDENLKKKPFNEENNDDKIHSRVPSRKKWKLFVVITIKSSFMVKSRLIIFTNSRNEGGGQILDENMSC